MSPCWVNYGGRNFSNICRKDASSPHLLLEYVRVDLASGLKMDTNLRFHPSHQQWFRNIALPVYIVGMPVFSCGTAPCLPFYKNPTSCRMPRSDLSLNKTTTRSVTTSHGGPLVSLRRRTEQHTSKMNSTIFNNRSSSKSCPCKIRFCKFHPIKHIFW